MIVESLRSVLRSHLLTEGVKGIDPRVEDLIRSPSKDNVEDYFVTLAASDSTATGPQEMLKRLLAKSITPTDAIEDWGLYDRVVHLTLKPLARKIQTEFEKFCSRTRYNGGYLNYEWYWNTRDTIIKTAKKALRERKNATLKVSFQPMRSDSILDMLIEFSFKTFRLSLSDSSIDPASTTSLRSKLVLIPSNDKRKDFTL